MRINDTMVALYDNMTVVRTFTDPQPLILTMTIMQAIPTQPVDIFPQEMFIDWVKVHTWVDSAASS